MHLVITIPGRRRARDAAPDWPALYRDLAERMSAALEAVGTEDAAPMRARVRGRDVEWREDSHPRADNGQFGKGGGGGQEALEQAEKPRPAAASTKGAFAALHGLLSTGKPFTKQELMDAAGMTREKKFSDYMAMLKNPKYAGAKGALQITRLPDGRYQVVTAEGRPAPPPPAEKPKPEAEKPPVAAKEPVPASPAAARDPGKPAAPGAFPKGLQTLENAAPYAPQPTGRAAAEFAVSNGYCDHADFGKLDPAVANAHLASLADHLAEFPALRRKTAFAGSIQAHAKHWRVGAKEKYKQRLKTTYPDLDEAEVERQAELYTPKLKAPGNAWAIARSMPDGTAAVCVNEKHAGPRKVGDLEEVLKHNVKTGFHPVGCDTVKSILDHEYGHALDYLLDLRKNPEVAQLRYMAYGGLAGQEKRAYGGVPVSPTASESMRHSVSRYAASNVQEFIAEAWAESKNNPEPRFIAKRLAEIVRTEYAKKFPRAD